MPRRRAVQPPPSTALVASAVKYPGKMTRVFRKETTGWQREAWRHYDICSELRFAANWIGNALSRATLVPATVTGGDVIKTEDPEIENLLAKLFGGPQGQAGMLGALGIHLTIAGEAFLVGRQVSGQDVWEVVSIREIEVTGSQWAINYGNDTLPVNLTENDVVIRIWRPHPALRMEADSPVRALLPVLTEIEFLTRHIFAQTTSRLVGAGIFVLPQGVTFPPPPENDGDPENTADQFMQMLHETMSAAYKDPGSAASQTPIVITVPDDVIDKIKEPIHFWSPFDAQAGQERVSAIERLALGLDIPPEIVMGMTRGRSSSGGTGTGASHWMAWQIEEAAIKLHIEPMLEVICSALSMQYLRPLSSNKNAAVTYDTTQLRLQPDRSKESVELFDRGELSGESMRLFNGFKETDAPDDDERKTWLIRKIAAGSATPEQVAAALQLLGVTLPDVPAPPDDTGTPRETRPAPSLENHPQRNIPDRQDAALVAASNALVLRALERAGNRLRQTLTKPPTCKAREMHTLVKANGKTNELLRDAWDMAPEVLDGLGCDVPRVTAALDSYVHTLLDMQLPHDPFTMQTFLAEVK